MLICEMYGTRETDTVGRIQEELASIDGDTSASKPTAILARRLLAAAGIEAKAKMPRDQVKVLARLEELRRNRGGRQ